LVSLFVSFGEGFAVMPESAVTVGSSSASIVPAVMPKPMRMIAPMMEMAVRADAIAAAAMKTAFRHRIIPSP